MIVILTEKPSARQNFSKALGGDKGTYKGEQYRLVNSIGHLFAYVDPEHQVEDSLKKKYKSWAISNLPWHESDFNWKREATDTFKAVSKELKEAFSQATEIVIGTDIDPSGEGMLLAIEILEGLKVKKSVKISRMSFIDESEKSLREAFENRVEIKDYRKFPEFLKGDFRSKWDFLSMQFTRAATTLLPGKIVLRQGRLKSPMVKLVGDGLKALNEHQVIYFYQNRFIDENRVVYTNPKEPKYVDEDKVPNKYKNSKVVLESKTTKTSPPPRLMDLANLSSILSARGYSTKLVLDTYQKMYTDGIVSYPRTEDKNITPEQFKELLPLSGKVAKVIGVDPSLLTRKSARKTHVYEGGSHGANRPGLKVPKDLNSIEKKYGKVGKLIYELVSKSFLALLCEDYEYEHQKGYLADYKEFKGSANIPKKLGWKLILGASEDDDDNNGKGLGTEAKPFVYKGEPPKPPVPTMRWLMNQLEKYEVGTGATRASTLSEITNKNTKYPLMNIEKGRLTLTPYGEQSYHLLQNTHIGDVKLTEEVVLTLKAIGKGDFSSIQKKLDEIEQLVLDDIETMSKNLETLDVRAIYGKSFAKVEKEKTVDEEGKTVEFKKEWGGHKFTEEEIKKLTNGETIVLEKLVNKKGKEYSVKGRLEWQEFKGKKFYGFKLLEFL